MIMTELRRFNLKTMIDTFGEQNYAVSQLASMLLERLCFMASIEFNDGNMTFLFKNDYGNKLSVIVDGGKYYLDGKIIKEFNDHISEYSITGEYFPHELFIVVNEIKMFFMGRPKNSVLFTGAFCPPHAGHRSVIENALNNGYDYAIVAVSNQKFLDRKMAKSNDMTGVIFSEQERVDMMLAMTFDIPNVLVYGPERGYTYEVLCDVKNKYNIEELSFACGSDKLREINRWGYHDKLLVEFGFYVMQREGQIEQIEDICKKMFKRYCVAKASMEYEYLSSTLVRTKIAEKLPITGLVTENVEKFLKKRKYI